VGKVTVTLNGFTHSWPHDVEVALVNPSGQELMLMEHTGAFYAVSNLVLTFDNTDTAAPDLPLATNLYSGTFLPTAYSPFDILPGLAPVPTANTNLSIFNGTDPNGAWSLYVYDDTEGNNGVITAGWSLGLTAVSLVNTAPATNAPPTWTNLVVSPGGIFEATLNGAMSQTYVVETSSNLVTWTPLITNTGVFFFTNSLGNASQRFYRAVQVSP
jgi:subtilisin-like proprotein convertase family protein